MRQQTKTPFIDIIAKNVHKFYVFVSIKYKVIILIQAKCMVIWPRKTLYVHTFYAVTWQTLDVHIDMRKRRIQDFPKNMRWRALEFSRRIKSNIFPQRNILPLCNICPTKKQWLHLLGSNGFIYLRKPQLKKER